MLTVKEVATKLKISLGAVYKAISAGDLECHRFGKSIRISQQQLDEYMKTSASNLDRQERMSRILKHL